MKITVPKGCIVKYKSPKQKFCKNDLDLEFEIDKNGFITTQFLKNNNMKVFLAHEEDCGCGTFHPFEAVSVWDKNLSDRIVIRIDKSLELYLGDISDKQIILRASNDKDMSKGFYALMGYDVIYELYYRNYSFVKRVKFIFKFMYDLIWRYLFKRG